MRPLAPLAALAALGLSGCTLMTTTSDPGYRYHASPAPLEPHFYRGVAPPVTDLWDLDHREVRPLDPQAPGDRSWREALTRRGGVLRYYATEADENALGLDEDVDFLPEELHHFLPTAMR